MSKQEEVGEGVMLKLSKLNAHILPFISPYPLPSEEK